MEKEVYERIRQEIEGVDCGEYDMDFEEIRAIIIKRDGDLYGLINDFVCSAFLRGQIAYRDHFIII